jgi:hypothetical protein
MRCLRTRETIFPSLLGRVAPFLQDGVMVADLDAHQLVQLYAVRAALEGTAAALAAQHAVSIWPALRNQNGTLL